jgi:hypothetical protein
MVHGTVNPLPPGTLHYGVQYLSDKLAAIDLTTMRVHHLRMLSASRLCHLLIIRYRKTIYTARTMPCAHGMSSLSNEARDAAAGGHFLPSIQRQNFPVLNPVRKAEATARLFTNALNPLSHPGEGLDAAIEIVSRAHCFELLSSKLQLTCELIKATFLKNISAGN